MKIPLWFIILAVIQVLLLILGVKIFFPKKVLQLKIKDIIKLFRKYRFYVSIIFIIVVFHLIEVNLVDPIITGIINRDYTPLIIRIEGNIVHNLSNYWTPLLVYISVLMYIAVYPFTLWFVTLYHILTDNKKSIKLLSYGLLLIYLVALPFYLFIPITNVYTYYNLESTLETVIPTVEKFFYFTTTKNNCLPSLHTAISILIVWSARLTNNKRLYYFTYLMTGAIIFSVLFLAIHWITDVIIGTVLPISTILIIRHFLKEKQG